jgi:hypothetical protein
VLVVFGCVWLCLVVKFFYKFRCCDSSMYVFLVYAKNIVMLTIQQKRKLFILS